MLINCDLHIHSCLSPCGDNDMTPYNIVNMASILGLDAIAVSDHNSAGNVEAAINAARDLPLTVVPAIEICSNEEVHLLSLFETLADAKNVSDVIYGYLPNIQNKPEIFGEQLYMDCEDHILAHENKLLINALTIGIEQINDIVRSNNGIVIPAHVDKQAYSIISNLGLIPSEYQYSCIEIYNIKNIIQFDGITISNSDAHYLENMRDSANKLELTENTAKCIIEYLRG